MARVFLSYSVVDERLSADIRQLLVDEGHEVFLDHHAQDGIKPGQAWEDSLHAQLRGADVTVCLVTSDYVRSRWCFAEIFTAQTLDQLILPVIVEPGAKHPLLDPVQRIDFTAEDGQALLLSRLREVDANGGVGWSDGLSPFPGLRAFDAQWRQAFCGRQNEVRKLTGLVNRCGNEMLLLVGPSGCGKSSLVRAGLVPAVGAEPGWLTLKPLAPGTRDDPVAELALVLAQRARELGLEWTVAEVRATLAAEGGLAASADELLAAAPGRRDRLLLVVDQFEELVTQTDAGQRQRFARLLAEGLRGRVAVAATLRPEFLAAVQADEELDELPRRLVEVPVLRQRTLAAVIEQPARLAGIRVDEELVDRLVTDTATGEALPLLAFTLQQLAEGVSRGGHLSAQRYEQLGGVAGALAGQADQALEAAVARTARSPAEVIAGLVRLVTVDERGQPTRWRVVRDDLPEQVRAELDEFVARRLLITDTRQGAVTVTVAHDAFLTSWPPLAEAIAEAGAALRMRPQVEHAAQEWRAAGRAPAHLWGDSQLARAMADLNRVELSAEAAEFLRASRRRERRRRTRAVTVLAGLLVLALVAAGLAVIGRQDAQAQQRIATVHSLMARAEFLRDRDPRTALRLSVAAHRISADERTQANLVNTLKDTDILASLDGHTAWVRSVAWSPDGRTVATASADMTVRLWDLTDREQPRHLTVLTGHTNPEVSLAWSPDSGTLATASADEAVLLWDLTDRNQPRRLSPLRGHTENVLSMAWSPDGRTLATAGYDKTVLLWDLTTRDQPRRLTGHGGWVESLAWSPDSRTLASASRDRTVRLWDLTELDRPEPVGAPLDHTDDVLSVAWSRDGHSLATASGNTVQLWDVTRRNQPSSHGDPLIGHTEDVWSVAWSPDGRTLATTSNDNTIRLWDVIERSPLGDPLTGHMNDVLSASWSPDGRTLATASSDLTVVLWEPGERNRPHRIGKLTSPADRVRLVAWSPDSRTLATADDHTVQIWDLTERNRPRRTGIPLAASVMSLAWSPDGRTLATALTDSTVLLWDMSGRPHVIGDPLAGHSGWARAMAWSPDSRTLATASEDSTVILWDLTQRDRPRGIGRLTDHTGPVRSVDWSPDGRTLATGSNDATAILWDLAERDRPRRMTTLTGHNRGVRSVAWSRDGRTLATASYDDTGQVWDLTEREEPRRIADLIGHISDVISLTWSQDSRTLITGSSDRTAVLWDLTEREHPRRIADLTGHAGGLVSLVWSRDSRTLATTSEDGVVLLWDLAGLHDLRDHAPAWACAGAGGGLTEHQWSRDVPTLPYRSTCPN